MNFKIINPLEDFLNDLFKLHKEKGFPKFFYSSRANVVVVLLVGSARVKPVRSPITVWMVVA